MKKSHRVAHKNQRRGGFCYYHYTALNLIVKNSFSKEYKKFSKQVTVQPTTLLNSNVPVHGRLKIHFMWQ